MVPVEMHRELMWCFHNVYVHVCVCVHAGERSVQSQAAPQLFPNGKYVLIWLLSQGPVGVGDTGS